GEGGVREGLEYGAVERSGGNVLSPQRLAAVLAHGHAVQSVGLFDFGLPLELFRHRRRACRVERGDDTWFPRPVHGDRVLVFQDRLSAEELTRSQLAPPTQAHRQDNAASNAFACFTSCVSKPSVNQPHIGARRALAFSRMPRSRQKRAALIAARSSQDFACCARAIVSARSKYASACDGPSCGSFIAISPLMRLISASYQRSLVVSTAVKASPTEYQASSNWPTSA